jgi:hypothetical protein
LLSAFNTISRARRYIEATPLAISSGDINDYLAIHELPVSIDIFTEVIFTLDNEFLDEVAEKIKKERKAKPSK